ncbi:MAG: polysaccharide deacetylase family protein [Bacteroidales bacterium]|nr:polysaccharide deacetylase family protein [Bacteroidales bacterium]
MLAIYSVSSSPRLRYALKLIFHEVLGVEYREVNHAEDFRNFPGARINYSTKVFDSCLQLIPSGLLVENVIKEQEISQGKWDELPVLYCMEGGFIPFDIFSAVFYLSSRYEEYLSSQRDSHGRYQAEESLAFRNDFLRLPIIDLWCIKLADFLGIRHACKKIEPGNYRFQLTVDIDQPWLYLHKGAAYSAGALARDLLRFRFADLLSRIMTLLKLIPDPGDTFDYLEGKGRGLTYPIRYFALCRRKGDHDINRSLNRRVFKELLRRLDASKSLGIHPSYSSFSSGANLDEELKWLEETLGRKVTLSRQHYLLFSFPDTCRGLLARGIKEDYSMGYSSQTGFRTGLARSCNFYDLLKEEETNLRLFPLMVMDRTLKDYLKLSPEKALEEFEHYIDQIRAVGGEFICLWHNDALSDRGEWKGWRPLFEAVINKHIKK